MQPFCLGIQMKVVQNVIRMSDIHGSQLLSDFQSFFSPWHEKWLDDVWGWPVADSDGKKTLQSAGLN